MLAQAQSIGIDRSRFQQSRDAERARIGADRNTLEIDFGKESATCHKTFFVNGCLDEVSARRRDALADLRRQEVFLNEQERKLKGAEKVQKTGEKLGSERLFEENEKRAAALKNLQSRVQRDQEKEALRLSSNTARSKVESDFLRFKRNEDEVRARLARQASSGDEASQFEQRQTRAKERQLKHQQEQDNRTKTPSNPLPVPQ